MLGFTWGRTGEATMQGICRMRVPTIYATVTVQPSVDVGQQATTFAAHLPGVSVELSMRINGPDVPLFSEAIVWSLRCDVEAHADDDPCGQCHGVGRYVALPGDVVADCPYCLGGGYDLMTKGQAVAEALLSGQIVQRVIGGVVGRS